MKILSALLAAIMALLNFTGLHHAPVLSEEWKTTVKENYAEFIGEVDGNKDRIPIIISTDQHGSITADSEFYSFINELVDWNKISKIINLGDTVENTYSSFELLSYRAATNCLPEEKRIEVIGNHDRGGLKSGWLANRYFPTSGAERLKNTNNFIVTDKEFNVRYLAVDAKNSPWSYTSGLLTSDMADFIIDELSKNTSEDIVFLSHAYLFKDEIIKRDGSTFTGSEFFIGDAEKYTDVKQSFIDMLASRNNKTAGVLIDCEGKSHNYDFSKCESEFLLALHGHHHTEGYETKDGITEFMFQSMRYDNGENNEPDCFYFAYIDRSTNTLKVWKNLPGYDAWEITFD